MLYIAHPSQFIKRRLKTILEQPGQRSVIGDDRNITHADWGSRLTTTKGKDLRQAIRQMNCVSQSAGETTYFPTDIFPKGPTKNSRLTRFLCRLY